VHHVFFPVEATDLKDSPSAKAVAERHEAWKAELPKDGDTLWDWLATRDDDRSIHTEGPRQWARPTRPNSFCASRG
jgi:ParB family transcriptional regulator, chromosome partitioning protein